ncbi:ESS1, partial [Symbiodinium sp. CCMP2592]
MFFSVTVGRPLNLQTWQQNWHNAPTKLLLKLQHLRWVLGRHATKIQDLLQSTGFHGQTHRRDQGELKRRQAKTVREKWWEKGPTLPGEGCTPAQRRLADDKAHITREFAACCRPVLRFLVLADDRTPSVGTCNGRLIPPTFLLILMSWTAIKERETKGGFVYAGNGKGTHMWRLKQERPDLFSEKDLPEEEQIPSGFGTCSTAGWLYNKDKDIYFELKSKRRFWFDESTRVHRALHEGEATSLCLSAGASAISANATPMTKHIVVPDIHGAAKALRRDFSHLDRPAGALAVLGASSGAAAPEAAARLLPDKLFKRLASFRSEWTDEMLLAALTGAFVDVAAGLGGQMPAGAAGLVVGRRVVVAASPGGCCAVARQPHAESSGAGAAPRKAKATGGSADTTRPELSLLCSARPQPSESIATHCVHLDASDALVLGLGVGDLWDQPEPALEAALPHVAQQRCRAGGLALFRQARAAGRATPPAAVALARLGPSSDEANKEAADASQPSKRPRVESGPSKVRLRQVLLRYAGSKEAKDPVRHKAVTRSREDAEQKMLKLVDDFMADACASFPSVCRSVSECASALKGGQMAGDLGWVDRPDPEAQKQKQEKDKAPPKLPLPSSVLKAAV